MDTLNDSAGAVLDLTLLRTFIEVVDCGGFALAADALALTPSAVSGHIKRLEMLAGATLLARTTRSFELTPAGQTLYAYARNIVDLEREARARLSGARLKGRLRIGSSEDFAGAWLAQVLQAFHRAHPDASIELKVGITADLLRQQARGKLDVVFGKQCARVQDEGELLWEEDLVWAWGEDQPWEPDAPVPLAVFPDPCVYRAAAIAALSQAGKPWLPAFESGSMAGCLAAAQAGFAVAPVARSQLREGLRALSQEDGMPDLPAARFYAYLRSEESAVQGLVSAVRQTGQRRRFSR
ncbi:HTH-type transcriptional regulator gltR [Achromobacter spanius]|uniref:LysR family transcriptional regulator n=1 Tax=Achromobacter spanius TaxID=217203 RepID=UPI000C2BFF93|nr:LysR family transcriptional regulator [Achromobacter spanius]AUA56756.1 LysR family transcriptional regulator [Achromobacter spanius]CAB3642907.1 HTH-type transcriptional regulator HdfR [Achromobacter spanius]SPT42406.1 HTH-type transcriptional regulator gltR [Achromobacter denitrificans]VEE55628.1 HTH-type transcriptional regulator gltR [Achromobacter spanius]